jgi:hypothetical protein
MYKSVLANMSNSIFFFNFFPSYVGLRGEVCQACRQLAKQWLKFVIICIVSVLFTSCLPSLTS